MDELNQDNKNMFSMESNNIFVANPNLKTLLLILIFVFLLSGIGLTIFALWGSAYRQELYEQTQAGLPKHQVKSSATDTSTWKTYRNEKYGFEFKYPEDANLASNGIIIITLVSGTKLFFEPVNVGRESVFDANSGVKIIKSTFAGKIADSYECPSSNICPKQLAFSKAIHILELPANWKNGNEIFYDVYKGQEKDKEILDQILSTFKFTN